MPSVATLNANLPQQTRLQTWINEKRAALSKIAGSMDTESQQDCNRSVPAVSDSTINIRGLTFLVADSNSFICSICNAILRGFGALRVLEAHDAPDAIKIFQERKIDLLMCDFDLPPAGGARLVRSIRSSKGSEIRTLPILMLSSDPRASTVAQMRDSGANMLVAKPLSAKSLYDRLAWIAFTPRKFIDAPSYFGPDRRFKIEGYPDGVGRRQGDQVADVGDPSGPALSQDDIDALLKSVRSG